MRPPVVNYAADCDDLGGDELSCQCANGYDCPHSCWFCNAARQDGCEQWCHVRPFDPEVAE